MKISLKLVLAFLLMTVLLGYVGYISLKSITLNSDNSDSINSQIVPMINSLNEMKIAALDVFSATAELKLYSVNESMESQVKEHEMREITDAKEEFDRSFKRYLLLSEAYAPGQTGAGEYIARNWEAFINDSGRILEFRDPGAGSNALFGMQQEFEGSKENLLGSIDGALAALSADLAKKQESARTATSISLSRIFVVVWIFVILSAMGIVLSYSITASITKLKNAADRIGKGWLGTRVKISSKDELGEFAAAFNKMAQDLKKSRQDIEERGVELTQKVNELTGTKSAMLNMMEDIDETNRKLTDAQKELKRNYGELKKLDMEKDKFISIAAHELKTPMTAIQGFAQLLENESVISNPGTRKKYIEIIDQEVKRLSKMVTEVLDLSRADLGAMKFRIEDVGVPELLKEVNDELAERAKEAGLALEFSVSDGVPQMRTDREKLKAILLNLIGNAINYTERGGIRTEAAMDRGNVKFSVADTGIGIPRKHFRKIFTRFYQVASPYTRKVGGTGLGLSICKEFVEAMGGEIWFDSKAGKGTTFYFTLPASIKESVAKNY